jgi:hypothetical protein
LSKLHLAQELPTRPSLNPGATIGIAENLTAILIGTANGSPMLPATDLFRRGKDLIQTQKANQQHDQKRNSDQKGVATGRKDDFVHG